MGLKRAAHHDVSRAHLVGDPQNKKPKFDHRNPSTLAQDAPDEDAILDLDEIGRGGQQSKRNAVRLEGYESDSSNENFDARADEKVKQAAKEKREAKSKDEEEEEEEENDMFADIEENENPDGDDDEELAREGKKRKKEVRFLDTNEIEGQVGSSHGGGHVSADFSMTPKDSSWKQSESSGEASDSSDGEHGDAQRDQVDSDVDDELGAGAKKKHAPRLDGFNMRSEAEEGRFDSTGNFVRNAKDPFEVHDAWLQGNSSKATMRKAAQAEEDRERERRERDLKDDAVSTGELLATLIRRMNHEETVLEALQRLGKGSEKKKTRPPFKKNRKKDDMEIDADEKSANGDSDATATKRKEDVEAITAAADQLLTRGQVEIYEAERALLARQYSRETGEEWVDAQPAQTDANGNGTREASKQWQYRWTDARDGGQVHGPFDGNTMKAWVDAGYFGDGVEFTQVGQSDWSRSVDFV